MFLVKSCKSKDNIKVRRTVRIGSLDEYRQTEIEEIADKNEGTIDYAIRLENKSKVCKYWMNHALGGFVHFGEIYESPVSIPGRINIHINNLTLSSSSSEYLYLENVDILARREHFNCYVFCMSAFKRPKFARGLFKGYDDLWSVGISSAGKISEILSGKVLEKAKDFFRDNPDKLPKGFSPDDLVIECEHKLVKYVPRYIKFKSTDRFSLDDLLVQLSDISFIKPPHPFSRECEYRFRFLLKAGSVYIEAWDNSLIVECPEILDLID